MSNYNSIYTGQQIDAAVGAVTTAVGNGGIVSLNGVQTILEDYLTTADAVSTYLTQADAENTYRTSSQVNSAILAAFPVGAIYETTTNTNPATFLGGTWSCISSMPRRIPVGSQCLWTGPTSGTGIVNKTAIIGAYQTDLISTLFTNVTIPSGWHQEFRLTAQIQTGGDNAITVYLNNIATNARATWSGGTYRHIIGSNYFRPSDIVQTTTLNYSSNGTNLYYSVSNSSNNWTFWNVIVSGYLTSDVTYYTWQRTS